MTAQRPESAPDAPYFCGVAYPTAEAAVAARNGMRHAPKGLRPKLCETGRHWHLRARNNRTGKHGSRSLRLPAGPGRPSTIGLTYRPGLAGEVGARPLASWVVGGRAPVSGQNGTKRSVGRVTER